MPLEKNNLIVMLTKKISPLTRGVTRDMAYAPVIQKSMEHSTQREAEV